MADLEAVMACLSCRLDLLIVNPEPRVHAMQWKRKSLCMARNDPEAQEIPVHSHTAKGKVYGRECMWKTLLCLVWW